MPGYDTVSTSTKGFKIEKAKRKVSAVGFLPWPFVSCLLFVFEIPSRTAELMQEKLINRAHGRLTT